MNREVDLSQYLPYDIIGKTPEVRGLQHSEELEFDQAWGLANYVQDASFIFTTDPASIVYWEKILSLPHEGTLEDRQRKVYIDWNRNVVWTHRTLQKWLDEAVRHDGYDMEIVYKDYEIFFDINIHRSNVSLAWLGRSLRDIIPANLCITIRAKIVNDLILQDSHTDWYSPLYKTGTDLWHSGQIYRQAYMGELLQEDLVLGSDTQIPEQHVYSTNEIYTGEVANDTR